MSAGQTNKRVLASALWYLLRRRFPELPQGCYGTGKQLNSPDKPSIGLASATEALMKRSLLGSTLSTPRSTAEATKAVAGRLRGKAKAAAAAAAEKRRSTLNMEGAAQSSTMGSVARKSRLDGLRESQSAQDPLGRSRARRQSAPAIVLQAELQLCQQLLPDSYFEAYFKDDSPPDMLWLRHMEGRLRLWIALFTRRILLSELVEQSKGQNTVTKQTRMSLMRAAAMAATLRSTAARRLSKQGESAASANTGDAATPSRSTPSIPDVARVSSIAKKDAAAMRRVATGHPVGSADVEGQ